MDFTWNATVLGPITAGISDALAAVVPIGIGIMGTLIGISVVKRVIYTFL